MTDIQEHLRSDKVTDMERAAHIQGRLDAIRDVVEFLETQTVAGALLGDRLLKHFGMTRDDDRP